MTKREKQLRLLRNQIARMEASREAAIKMLVKAETELPVLRKRAKRWTDAFLKRDAEIRRLSQLGPRPGEDEKETRRQLDAQVDAIDQEMEQDDGLEIPAILDRNKKLQALPDPKTKEKTAERRAIEKEVREAKLRGLTKRWPATGKAALAQLK